MWLYQRECSPTPATHESFCSTRPSASLAPIPSRTAATRARRRAVLYSMTPAGVPNPSWRIALDCIDVMSRIGGKFGLTPSDRAGLDVSEVQSKPTHGPEHPPWIYDRREYMPWLNAPCSFALCELLNAGRSRSATASRKPSR